MHLGARFLRRAIRWNMLARTATRAIAKLGKLCGPVVWAMFRAIRKERQRGGWSGEYIVDSRRHSPPRRSPAVFRFLFAMSRIISLFLCPDRSYAPEPPHAPAQPTSIPRVKQNRDRNPATGPPGLLSWTFGGFRHEKSPLHLCWSRFHIPSPPYVEQFTKLRPFRHARSASRLQTLLRLGRLLSPLLLHQHLRRRRTHPPKERVTVRLWPYLGRHRRQHLGGPRLPCRFRRWQRRIFS